MKSKIKIVIMILLIANIMFITKPFKGDRFIKYNISSDVSMLFLTIDRLERELLVDDRYKTSELEEIKNVITDCEGYIYQLDKSIGKYNLLNSNYDLNMYGLCDYMYMLKKKINLNIRPSDEDMQVLRDIKELRRTYSNAAVMALYEDDGNTFINMKLPEKTKVLFEKMNQLTNYK